MVINSTNETLSKEMLLVTDKIFLALVLLCSSPLFCVVAVVSADLVSPVVFLVVILYVALSIRLVASNCIFIKSVGYGVASAPILLAARVQNDDTVG